MEQLLSAPEGRLRREASGAFFAPARPRSSCSGDVGTESSSTFEDVEEQQHNSRRITLCKQVLLEATTKFSAAPLVDMTLMKNVACRNSGALGPLLSMLMAEQDVGCMIRCLDTLSFLLLDRANRRACHELGGLDVLLDILRRVTDQQVLLCGLEALCSLCKHDVKDKMALWRHKKKGYLLSMLNTRHGTAIVVETLRTCRTLCFAVCSGGSRNSSTTNLAGLPLSSSYNAPTCQDHAAGSCGAGGDTAGCYSSRGAVQPQPCGSGGGAAVSTAAAPAPGRHSVSNHHHNRSSRGNQQLQQQQQHQQQSHGTMQLLEPSLLGMVSGLLHPAADTVVMMKVLKLLTAASSVASCTAAANNTNGAPPTSTSGPAGSNSNNSINCSSSVAGGLNPSCCGCWRNPVFQLVPLLTHCADLSVVESALTVLVNLSEHPAFHRLLDASGCVFPLLHLLSHKRCVISQSASCILSALAEEGGLSRVKLCQDTALLAMLRVLQTNHCVVVTMGVLYMLGQLASYRSSVVRSLKGWGAVPLLNRLLATTRDADAAEGCRQLLQLLGATPLPTSLPQVQATAPAPQAPKLSLLNAHSSIAVFGGGCNGDGGDGAAGSSSSSGLSPHCRATLLTGSGSLVRTISAAETVVAIAAEIMERPAEVAVAMVRPPSYGAALAAAAAAAGCGPGSVEAAVVTVRHRQHNSSNSSFRFIAGASPGGCGLLGSVATAAAAAAY